jgi:hypothetical protein
MNKTKMLRKQWSENVMERNHWQKHGIDGRIILE